MRRSLLAFALLVAAGPALAVDGLLDSTFGIFSTGRNVVAIDEGGTNSDTLASTLVAADGSIFLIGTTAGNAGSSRFSITRLTSDGIVDLDFGDGGSVLPAVTNVRATRAKLDPTGNILIVGSRGFSGTDRDFILCRYNQQGQPVAFSGLGTNCATIAFDFPGGNLTDVANDVIVEPNGKFVLAGVSGVSAVRDRAAVARLMPDGTPDPNFGTDGKSASEPNGLHINRYNAIARRPDGKYIAVGESGDKDGANGTGALFARLTTVGSLDPSFQSGNGHVLYSLDLGDEFNRDESASAITILADGKMLMAGKAQISSNSEQLISFVFKLSPLDFAAVDPAFGTSGLVKIGAGYSYTHGEMLVQSDGKIILVGTSRPSAAQARDVHIVRLLADGSLDNAGFGNVGRTNIDFVLPGELDFGISGALQNGRIIVAGHSLQAAPQNYNLTVARLSNDLIFANGLD